MHSSSLLMLLGLGLGMNLTLGEPKVIDQRAERTGPATHSIVFMARSGVPGHAFVAWGVDSKEEQMCLVKAFGFYPGDGKKGVVGPVPGTIVDETKKHGLTRGEPMLIVRVDPAQYRKTEEIRRRWEKKTYQMTRTDCISFAREVAGALDLDLPDRKTTDLPIEFIKRLAEVN